jgi:uncharacterized protein YggT (Ycf19 family)
MSLEENRRVADDGEQEPVEHLKRKLHEDLHEELQREAHRETPTERKEVEAVAHELKRHTISEVVESERGSRRTRRLERVYAIVDYVFFVIYGLVGLMIGLELLGARDGSGFMRFMRTVTTPILAPFKGVMPDPAIGSVQLMLSYVLALVVYILLHRAVRRLFRLLIARRPVGL